jgi:two-component system, cell cycle sensor histidine kinase and response regulator CckA
MIYSVDMNKLEAWDEETSTVDGKHDRVTAPPVSKTQEASIVGRERGQLIILVGTGAGRTYTIDEDELVIGRALEAHVHLPADDVSRRHARIYRTSVDGPFAVEDLSSRNGTLVNGVPVKQQVLHLGDKIRVGAKTILMFTQFDELEDQLLQSQKMESIGRLAGGVAHDFNNLLGAILANTSFLRGLGPQACFDDRDVVASIEDIETAARRAADLTKQLLGFARRGNYEKRPVDVMSLLDEIKALSSRTFEKKVTVTVTSPPELTLLGDASQLHQVLMNLCINARDAMPDGGDLSIIAELVHLSEDQVLTLPFLMPGDFVVISVRDNGVGMDAETLRRAFEPFFTTKGPGKGTGMGLATAYGIVKNHGGHIQAESELGKGSAFKVYLPAADRPTAKVLGIEAEFSQQGGTRKIHAGLVLVVEDEEIFRNSARRLLEGMGFGVLCAVDGVEAIKVFQSHRDLIQLVLLDMIMPEMGGVETFHELRKIKPQVKVLLNSGYTELHSVRALLAAGAEGFLQKPYDAGALAEAISKAMFAKA